MYSYAWGMVSAERLIGLAAEDNFTSTDILAELFLLNINPLLRRGLHRQYVNCNTELGCVRGKINLIETMTKLKFRSGRIHCEFDELTEDILLNQILKYVALKLYHCCDLNSQHRKSLRKVLACLHQVSYQEITMQDLNDLAFNRMNLHYKLIIKICELIIKSTMLSSKEGEFEFDELFQDERELEHVFELFAYNFCRQELPRSCRICYQGIMKWQLTGGNQDLLPNLKPDVQIKTPEETLIIDLKFYKSYLTENFDTKKFHSGHLYQMSSYLQNTRAANEHQALRGILLYPQPYEDPAVHESYCLQILSDQGVKPASLEVHTLNLGNEWWEIRQELLEILNFHTG